MITWAFVSIGRGSVWWAPSLGARPVRIFKPAGIAPVDNSVRIAGRYLIFTAQAHGYLADTRAHKYFPFDAYPVAIDRRELIVVGYSKRKTLHPKSPVMLVPVRSLPRLSRCA